MVKPLVFARSAAPAILALVAALGAPGSASAQFYRAWGWGGWGPPPARVYAPPPMVYEEDAAISPRIVASLLRARGYRLATAPRYAGDRVIALGENSAGFRARFIIDAYDGALIRMVRVDGRQPGFVPGRPRGDVALGAPGEYGDPDLAAPPPGPLAPHRPMAKPKPKTAARTPAEAPRLTPAKPAPGQASRAPAAPGPAAAPVIGVAAPQTPLAPDAQPAAQAKPAGDIGPRVEPVVRATEAAAAPATPTSAAQDQAPAGAPAPDLTR